MEIERLLIGGGAMILGILFMIFSKPLGEWIAKIFVERSKEENNKK